MFSKASGIAISGVFSFGLAVLVTPNNAQGMDCPRLTPHERVQVSSVYDGDTLRLQDGRRVRLIAVNAPELARDGKSDQPLARASRAAVEAFIADTEFVHLSFESRRADRYGRVLAHVTLPSGRNLESHLVRLGLAYPLAIPPDLQLADCLQAEAEQARREHMGIWQTPFWLPLYSTSSESTSSESASSDELAPGFLAVCGKLTKVDRKRDVYLELSGSVVLRIAKQDLIYFDQTKFKLSNIEQRIGDDLSVAGWLIDRRQQRELKAKGFLPWLMQVRSHHAIRWQDSCHQVAPDQE